MSQLRYLGPSQPMLAPTTHWLGRLSQLLGASAGPAYVDASPGTPGPVLGRSGQLAVPQSPCAPTGPSSGSHDAAAPCPATCDPFAQGPIAILVPRPS